MPIPTPKDNETQEQFIDRCMIDETMVNEYDDDQRLAVCISTYEDNDMEENKELENAPQEMRTTPEKEVRTFDVKDLELRQDGDSNVVVGYASVFNTLSNDDVRFLINHDGLPLARTTNGTLRLSTDATGLRYEAEVANTSLGRDLVELMKDGTINQSSFAFTVEDDSWEVNDGMNVRTIKKVSRLYDVSAVTYPAYEEASVGLRSMEAWQT